MADVAQDTQDTLLGISIGDANILETAIGLRDLGREGSGLDPRTYALVKIAAGADLFVCEAGADAREDPDTGWHLTPEDAGDVATRAGVGSLLLTHLAPGLSAEAAASRAALHFAGTVKVAIQGRTYRAAKNV